MAVTERKKKTVLNAFANVVQLVVSGVAGLIVMRILLVVLGSNYNGLNSTVAQLMSVLVLVSSSFTTASLIAMYKPYNNDDWKHLNLIISTSRRVFRFIGLGVLIVGSIACVIYAHFISSDIPVEIITVVLFLSLISTVFNIVVVNTYRLVFQVSQTEYIVTAISTCYTIVVSTAASIAIVLTEDIIVARSCYVVLEIASGLFIQFFAFKRFEKLKFTQSFDYALVKGTKDVFATSLTGVIYRTSPTLFLASIIGTAATSVYYVYDSIISLVRSVVQVFISAPKNAFGQVIHEENEKKTQVIFQQYEYVTFFASSILLSVTFAVIMPFVKIYTVDVAGADYLIRYVPVLLILTAFFEAIHIPSGLAIQLSGEFKLAKRIQYSALFVLLVLLIVLGLFFEFPGILIAVLITSVQLMIEEVYFARKRVLHFGLASFAKVFIIHFALFALLGCIESVVVSPYIADYLSFTIISMVLLVFNAGLVSAVGKLLFKENFYFIYTLVLETISGIKKALSVD